MRNLKKEYYWSYFFLVFLDRTHVNITSSQTDVPANPGDSETASTTPAQPNPLKSFFNWSVPTSINLSRISQPIQNIINKAENLKNWSYKNVNTNNVATSIAAYLKSSFNNNDSQPQGNELKNILEKLKVNLNNKELLPKVKSLIDNGADIHTTTDSGETALSLVLKKIQMGRGEPNGLWALVKYLIDNGADIHTTTDSGETALSLVLKKIQMNSGEPNQLWALVKYLIEKGADVNTLANNQTALYLAAVKKLPELVIQFLLTKGADQNAGNPSYNYYINYSHMQNIHKELINNQFKKTLAKLQDDPENKEELWDRVKELIEKGVDINTLENNVTALYIAAVKKRNDMVTFLLNKDANQKAGSPSYNDYKKSINNQLKDTLANLQEEPENKEELWHRVKELIETGADINTLANNQTALYLAAKNKNNDMVTFLLNKRADRYAGNPSYNYLKIFEDVAKAPSSIQPSLKKSINNQLKDTLTNLQGEPENKEELWDRVKELIENGADINTLANNQSALAVAGLHENNDMVTFLLNKDANKNAGSPSYNDYMEIWKAITPASSSSASANDDDNTDDDVQEIYSIEQQITNNATENEKRELSNKGLQLILKHIAKGDNDNASSTLWDWVGAFLENGADINTAYTDASGNKHTALSLADDNRKTLIEKQLKKLTKQK